MRGLRWLRERLWSANSLASFDTEGWLVAVRAAQPTAVALVVPKWRGVARATAELFPCQLPIPPELAPRAATRVADLVRATGVRRVVFGSFTVGMCPLLDRLSEVRPRLELFALYHSNLLHQSHDTN